MTTLQAWGLRAISIILPMQVLVKVILLNIEFGSRDNQFFLHFGIPLRSLAGIGNHFSFSFWRESGNTTRQLQVLTHFIKHLLNPLGSEQWSYQLQSWVIALTPTFGSWITVAVTKMLFGGLFHSELQLHFDPLVQRFISSTVRPTCTIQ